MTAARARAPALPQLLLLCLVAATASTPAAPAAVAGPEALVREVTQNLIHAVRARRAAIARDPSLAYPLIEDIVTPHVDLHRIAVVALGAHWREADAAQRVRFQRELHILLVRIFATMVADYADVNIRYLPLRQAAGGTDALVQTRVNRPGGPGHQVDFRMHRTGDAWKLYDVALDGVSLLLTYREQVAATVGRGGLDALIDRMAATNGRLAVGARPSDPGGPGS